jgi:hypothetical protein
MVFGPVTVATIPERNWRRRSKKVRVNAPADNLGDFKCNGKIAFAPAERASRWGEVTKSVTLEFQIEFAINQIPDFKERTS